MPLLVYMCITAGSTKAWKILCNWSSFSGNSNRKAKCVDKTRLSRRLGRLGGRETRVEALGEHLDAHYSLGLGERTVPCIQHTLND